MKLLNHFLAFFLLSFSTQMIFAKTVKTDIYPPTNSISEIYAENQKGEKKYEIEGAIITYTYDLMGMKSEVKTYFNNYGANEAHVTKTKMSFYGQDIDIESRTLIKDGYVYTLNMKEKTGTKVKISEEEMSLQHFDFKKMTAEMKTAINFKSEGSETFLGKACQIYSYSDKESKGKFWLWKNIAVKWQVEGKEGTMTFAASSIVETTIMPSGIFDIPKDIEIQEFDQNPFSPYTDEDLNDPNEDE